MENEEDMIRAWVDGDPQAFGRVVEVYKGAVYATVLTWVGDYHQAQDLAAETFVQAHQARASLKDPARLGAWLRGIAQNLGRNWFNRQRRRETSYEGLVERAPWCEAELQAEWGPDRTPPLPDLHLEKDQARQQLWRGLYAVPEISREVLLLFYLRQMTQQEIAAYLGIAPGAVRDRLYTARGRIKKEIERMLKNSVTEKGLPENFTAKVVEEAVARGRALLAERAWPQARQAFLRALDLDPDSRPAHDGLSEAVASGLVERLRQPLTRIDRQELEEALAELKRAYQTNGDAKTMILLAMIFHHFERCEEYVEVLWDFALHNDDIRAAFRAGCRGVREMGQRCIADPVRAAEGRRVLWERFADKLEPADKLDFFLMLKIGYTEQEQIEEWLKDTRVLELELGDSMHLAQRFFYSRTRASALRQIGRNREGVEWVDEFVEWIEQDPRSHPHKVRFVTEMLGKRMMACHALGEQEEVRVTIARAEEWVAQCRTEWKEFRVHTDQLDETMRPQLEGLYRYMMEYTQPDQILFEAPLVSGPLDKIRADLYEQYRRSVSWSAGNLACDCTFSGEKELAIRLFEENMAYIRGQGWGEPEGNWHLWMAGLKLEVRQDRKAALYHLRQAAKDSRIVAKGDLKRRFGHMRHDSEFREVIDTAVLN